MKPKKNALEWIVFAASVGAIAAVLVLLFAGRVNPAAPRPDLIVETAAPLPGQTGHLIPVTVRNRGGATAEQARIQVALVSGSAELETAELTMAFVPRHSKREGWVLFRRDPHCCTVAARAVSYETP